MLHWISYLIGALNYSGVAILMAIENIFLPLPSELIMPLAGFETANGRLSLFGVIIAGTIGSVLGALPLYYAGRALGEERPEKWLERYGRWTLLRGKDLERATARFSGNSFVDVIIAQMVPGVRGLISIPAGLARMNLALFLVANLIGTVVWCTMLALAGRILGANFTRIHQFLGPVGWTILGILIAGLGVWAFERKRRRARGQRA
ncbi:MAG TPA: alkaline phosphatase [Gemmatimonadetes bacterium]|jgi:membrane protein DedA with SNARE-associated domain|nr:alkaline phosphatase [Gemmatimonadota bacterium]